MVTKTSMTVNLVVKHWSIGTLLQMMFSYYLIFKSGSGNRGGNTDITTCRLFDPSETTSNLIDQV